MVISATNAYGAQSRANLAGFLGAGELPLVDRTVLEALESQLGQPDMSRSCARDYSATRGQRERCLIDSLARDDRPAALDAAINLKVSSAMVGCLRLACLDP